MQVGRQTPSPLWMQPHKYVPTYCFLILTSNELSMCFLVKMGKHFMEMEMTMGKGVKENTKEWIICCYTETLNNLN